MNKFPRARVPLLSKIQDQNWENMHQSLKEAILFRLSPEGDNSLMQMQKKKKRRRRKRVWGFTEAFPVLEES